MNKQREIDGEENKTHTQLLLTFIQTFDKSVMRDISRSHLETRKWGNWKGKHENERSKKASITIDK